MPNEILKFILRNNKMDLSETLSLELIYLWKILGF